MNKSENGQKTIKINTDFFKMNKSLNKSKKNKPQKPIINPSELRNKLIQRLKERRNKDPGNPVMFKVKTETKEDTLNIKSEDDEFKDSINYLSKISESEKKTLKSPPPSRSQSPVLKSNAAQPQMPMPIAAQPQMPMPAQPQMPMPAHPQMQIAAHPQMPIAAQPQMPIAAHPQMPIAAQPQMPIAAQPQNTSYKDIIEPPHGCLKGGNKPTFRTWNKTLKNNNISFHKLHNERENITEQKGLKENKEHKEQTNIQHPVIKKTIRKKYILGKNKSGKVGILIKDKNTRKRILNAQNELKRKPMNEIKKYLIDHGLIKIGTYAPNDVIRKIYESSVLSGDVSNQQKDVLLHNYNNSDENK